MDSIYDLGANNGQNLKYYLSKSKKVFALEANPVLVERIRKNFYSELSSGALTLINKCLTNVEGGGYVDFYVNKYSSGLSRFTPPNIHPEDFRVIQIEQITYGELVKRYGRPDMVKIDLEGYDKIVIDYMIENGLLPPYLQFENCGIDVIEKLEALHFYKCWNIVAQYNRRIIYKKSNSSAVSNPINGDIVSPWLDSISIIHLYKNITHSWFDVHAKIDGECGSQNIFKYYEKPFSFLLTIKKIIPHKLKAFIKRIVCWER